MTDWYRLPVAYDLDGALVIEIPRKLESPNKTRGYHWRIRHKDRALWEAFLWGAVMKQRGVLNKTALAESGGSPKCSVPMVIAVTRYVPNSRQFIADDDNLVFSAKPLHDALKRIGLIKDDRRGWLRTEGVTQAVSPDGRARTVITLRPDTTNAEVRTHGEATTEAAEGPEEGQLRTALSRERDGEAHVRAPGRARRRAPRRDL